MNARQIKEAAIRETAAAFGMSKTAFIGPVMDLGNLGIPSLAGYALGGNFNFKNAPKSELADAADEPYSAIHGLMVPGYTGYHFGKRQAAQRLLNRLRNREVE